VSQSRFTYSGDDDGTRWPTPYRVRQGSTTERLFVEGDGASLASVGGNDAVVVGNADGTGFVRTHYAGELFDRVVEGLGSLSAIERYVLIDDTWAGVLAAREEAGAFLRLTERYGDETDNATWQAVLEGLGWLDRLLDGEPRDGFRGFVRSLVGPAAGRSGWEVREGESDLQREMRGTLLRALGVLGRDEDTIERAREIERTVRSGGSVDGPIGAASIAIAATAGSAEDHVEYLRMYTDGRSPQEQRRYLASLVLFPQPELADVARAAVLAGDVRSQDRPWVVGGLLSSREHGEKTWEWLKSNFDALSEGLTPHLRLFMVEAVRALDTKEMVADVAAFFEANPMPGVEMMLRQSLERQRIAADLRDREAARLAAHFGG